MVSKETAIISKKKTELAIASPEFVTITVEGITEKRDYYMDTIEQLQGTIEILKEQVENISKLNDIIIGLTTERDTLKRKNDEKRDIINQYKQRIKDLRPFEEYKTIFCPELEKEIKLTQCIEAHRRDDCAQSFEGCPNLQQHIKRIVNPNS